MSAKAKTVVSKKGNPIANNPLMRKGGVHKKTRSSQRQKHKRETHKLVEKYRGIVRRRRGTVSKRASSTSKVGLKRQATRYFADDQQHKKESVVLFFMSFTFGFFSISFI
ncbi:MAG: hypothetical protein KAG20_05375 [Cocleimonas sp.]|nr:hypothetical protein [Cocleimonas sp.]